MTRSQTFPLTYKRMGNSEIWGYEHIVLCIGEGSNGTAFVKYCCENCSEIILVEFDEKHVYDCKGNIIKQNRYPRICLTCGDRALNQLRVNNMLNFSQLYGYHLGLRIDQKINILYDNIA